MRKNLFLCLTLVFVVIAISCGRKTPNTPTFHEYVEDDPPKNPSRVASKVALSPYAITNFALNASGTDLVATWDAVDGTKDYRIAHAKESADGYISWRAENAADGNGYPTTNTFTIPSTQCDTIYKAIVRARFTGKNSGPWSNEVTGSVPCADSNTERDNPPPQLVETIPPEEEEPQIAEQQQVAFDISETTLRFWPPDKQDFTSQVLSKTNNISVAVDEGGDTNVIDGNGFIDNNVQIKVEVTFNAPSDQVYYLKWKPRPHSGVGGQGNFTGGAGTDVGAITDYDYYDVMSTAQVGVVPMGVEKDTLSLKFLVVRDNEGEETKLVDGFFYLRSAATIHPTLGKAEFRILDDETESAERAAAEEAERLRLEQERLNRLKVPITFETISSSLSGTVPPNTNFDRTFGEGSSADKLFIGIYFGVSGTAPEDLDVHLVLSEEAQRYIHAVVQDASTSVTINGTQVGTNREYAHPTGIQAGQKQAFFRIQTGYSLEPHPVVFDMSVRLSGATDDKYNRTATGKFKMLNDQPTSANVRVEITLDENMGTIEEGETKTITGKINLARVLLYDPKVTLKLVTDDDGTAEGSADDGGSDGISITEQTITLPRNMDEETFSIDVSIQDDDELEGDETFFLGVYTEGLDLESVSHGQSLIKRQELTINASDRLYVVTDPENNLRIRHPATSGVIKVKLGNDPGAETTVTVASGAWDVSPSTLTFTSGTNGNWDTDQTVTITGRHADSYEDGHIFFSVFDIHWAPLSVQESDGKVHVFESPAVYGTTSSGEQGNLFLAIDELNARLKTIGGISPVLVRGELPLPEGEFPPVGHSSEIDSLKLFYPYIFYGSDQVINEFEAFAKGSCIAVHWRKNATTTTRDTAYVETGTHSSIPLHSRDTTEYYWLFDDPPNVFEIARTDIDDKSVIVKMVKDCPRPTTGNP